MITSLDAKARRRQVTQGISSSRTLASWSRSCGIKGRKDSRVFSILCLAICLLAVNDVKAQDFSLSLGNFRWKFREAGSSKWYPAELPGTVHTDLLKNKLIPDPFYRDNESRVQWVEEKTWEYQTVFSLTSTFLSMQEIWLEFDGLDTYAEVFLNGQKIITSDNMFRQWRAEVKKELSPKNANTLLIRFLPAATIAREKKKKEPLAYPDNERIYTRKAQYQFGWDWGPRLVTAGIWKEARVRAFIEPKAEKPAVRKRKIRLVREPDEVGETFYFTVDGQPVFMKGANWIPADNFIPRAVKLKKYEALIKAAKEANINMLRVWGGGIYEEDIFYQLCDQYGILVWQDFMFAGALYPADSEFLKNVEEEVRYQVKRLRKYDCIALWCGNNEIEEAWFNWGWQKQFGYSPADSAKLWGDYKKIFHELIPGILKELDPERTYWPSSPSLGWGRKDAYEKGDVHYWGVWWGKEPVERYSEKVGRFNSEYGMQGMPSMRTIRQFAVTSDLDTTSQVMKTHQKHPFGYENISRYILNKFRQPKTFEDLVYVSQLMQADALRTAISAHRKNAPVTMGTLFWQWNDCWPVVSWSAIDHYGRKKAAWYEVKRMFADPVILPFADTGIAKLKLVDVKEKGYYSLLIDSFNLQTGAGGGCELLNFKKPSSNAVSLEMDAFPMTAQTIFRYRLLRDGKAVAEDFQFNAIPASLLLKKPKWTVSVEKGVINIAADQFAYGVFIDLPDGVKLGDNYFHVLPGEKKSVSFESKLTLTEIRKAIKIRSLVDTYSEY